jgi:hypothetical protein
VMLSEAGTEYEVVVYEVKLVALSDRYAAGARSLITAEAQECAGALTCLLEEAPLGMRERIDHLIDRYEALRINSLS